MQNQMRTWKEIFKKKKKKKTCTLVSSIQYAVSDTMHVTKQAVKEKNLLHIHTKLTHNLNFMKNERRVSTRLLTAQRPTEPQWTEH